MDVAIIFIALFVLLFLGMSIAFALGLMGVVGLAWRLGFNPALSSLGTTASDTVLNYDFAVLPLFILMGNLVARSGVSRDLYVAANAWLGGFRGGLAMATVTACAGFGAVCGSSLATAATMAKVAVPPMRAYRYHDSLAAGSVAAGGTLGIMIPPSVPMVFYGIMTETDIGKIFVAGILPGMLGAVLYSLSIWVTTLRNPEVGPAGPYTPLRAKIIALKGVWGMLALFALVIGGIYGGFFTPTEAAGIGAGGAVVLAALRRNVTIRDFGEVLVESARTTVMMIVILIGALLFATYINVAGVPTLIGQWVKNLDLAPIFVIFIIILIYVILGCLMESLSMMLLTVPVFYPVVAGMGYDLIWFGIVIITVIEIGLITPPIGLNVFVLRAVLPDIPMQTVFRGIFPFIYADIVRVTILVLFPAISLFLPSFMR
jgi:tripartite ATP-independent transporter DctM subunit